ncbi:MAG: N-acetyltransferase [Armatimonadota bacterium]
MNPNITIRPEKPADIDAIRRLTEAAFQNQAHASHTEQFIVTALRRAGTLTVSLVAVENDVVVGHVAVSPVTVSSGAAGWYGLGPISVQPNRQGRSIGSRLMTAALAELRRIGAQGCVVLGDPAYYGRFGFKNCPGLELPGVPQVYFQAFSLGGEVPAGTVRFHEAFDATE